MKSNELKLGVFRKLIQNVTIFIPFKVSNSNVYGVKTVYKEKTESWIT